MLPTTVDAWTRFLLNERTIECEGGRDVKEDVKMDRKRTDLLYTMGDEPSPSVLFN